jgi:hypothetical protein
MSEVVCLRITIACVSEKNNATRKWNKKQRMWTKEWLNKRSNFSHYNFLRELEMPSLLDCKAY